MTEQEWLECADPTPMLDFLRGKASDRKLRLFGCACCWSVLKHLWSGETGRQAILIAERFADGLTAGDDLEVLRRAVSAQLELFPAEPVYDASYWACSNNIQDDVERCSFYAANNSTRPFDWSGKDFDDQAKKRRGEELAAQASFVRDLFGPLPFHSMTIDPRWLTSTVADLSQAIYEEHAFDRMPILSDALMDAGCDNEDVIAHCRGEGPHVRGCWVVDLLTGRK